MDASQAPHGQLPYIADGDRIIGDSDAIIAHLIARDGLGIDAGLTPAQRDTDHLVRRMLDDLYWVISYSRWQDDRFWPAFRDAFLRFHPAVAPETLEAARAYNFKRYHAQGIGRLAPDEAFARGIADLEVLSHLLPEAASCSAPNPAAPMPGSMAFSPISCSSRSTRRCSAACKPAEARRALPGDPRAGHGWIGSRNGIPGSDT